MNIYVIQTKYLYHMCIRIYIYIYIYTYRERERASVVPASEKTPLSCEPMPCSPEAEAAPQPLIWHSEG